MINTTDTSVRDLLISVQKQFTNFDNQRRMWNSKRRHLMLQIENHEKTIEEKTISKSNLITKIKMLEWALEQKKKKENSETNQKPKILVLPKLEMGHIPRKRTVLQMYLSQLKINKVESANPLETKNFYDFKEINMEELDESESETTESEIEGEEDEENEEEEMESDEMSDQQSDIENENENENDSDNDNNELDLENELLGDLENQENKKINKNISRIENDSKRKDSEDLNSLFESFELNEKQTQEANGKNEEEKQGDKDNDDDGDDDGDDDDGEGDGDDGDDLGDDDDLDLDNFLNEDEDKDKDKGNDKKEAEDKDEDKEDDDDGDDDDLDLDNFLNEVEDENKDQEKSNEKEKEDLEKEKELLASSLLGSDSDDLLNDLQDDNDNLDNKEEDEDEGGELELYNFIDDDDEDKDKDDDDDDDDDDLDLDNFLNEDEDGNEDKEKKNEKEKEGNETEKELLVSSLLGSEFDDLLDDNSEDNEEGLDDKNNNNKNKKNNTHEEELDLNHLEADFLEGGENGGTTDKNDNDVLDLLLDEEENKKEGNTNNKNNNDQESKQNLLDQLLFSGSDEEKNTEEEKSSSKHKKKSKSKSKSHKSKSHKSKSKSKSKRHKSKDNKQFEDLDEEELKLMEQKFGNKLSGMKYKGKFGGFSRINAKKFKSQMNQFDLNNLEQFDEENGNSSKSSRSKHSKKDKHKKKHKSKKSKSKQKNSSEFALQEQLLKINLDEKTNTSQESSKGIGNKRNWNRKAIFRGHFDSVQSIDWHDTAEWLVSGSDDSTIKLWSMSKRLPSLSKKKRRHKKKSRSKRKEQGDIVPICTFRGHKGPIFKVCFDSPSNLCFSAGSDTVIRSWDVPSWRSKDPLYNSYGAAVHHQFGRYEGHKDAVWDLVVNSTKGKLISASSDATIKIWDIEANGEPSLQDYLFPNLQSIENYVPTSICLLENDKTKLIAAYNAPVFCLFDLETSQIISTFRSFKKGVNHDSMKGQNCLIDLDNAPKVDPNNQINSIKCHPTDSVVIVGCESNLVNSFDIRNGECRYSLFAHQDSVSSVDFANSGKIFGSVSHDATLGIWDYGTGDCIQVESVSRKKYDEGINCIKFHKSSNLMAVGPADAQIRIFC
ncbi:striatin [Anaeramoeba flamelloides]|uniref:Striatin n=1 Tax=Anaeramoeba flamelloides TaxID=1746091 RepID=A0AAV7ZSP5_9EUKA|nr:striatin [Anaeramoeba flamelloides]